MDDCLSPWARTGCDDHLKVCPVCRARLAELQSITRGLSMLARAAPPSDLAGSISDALMIEAAARESYPELPLPARINNWLRPRLMPYTIGSFASVVLFFAMFAGLRPHVIALREAAFVARQAESTGADLNQPLTPENYAALRAPYSVESPSLNPDGALAALMWSHSHRGRHSGSDDMIIVADVFSNGVASLTGVMQPPRDRRMLEELETALRKDAAFVPASFDHRPETMRVVFAVQRVEVSERSF